MTQTIEPSHTLQAPVEAEHTAPSPKPRRLVWQMSETLLNGLAALGLLLLAVGFMWPGIQPGRVAAPMDGLVPFVPWNAHFPGVNPPFHGGDMVLQQLPWRHWMQDELAAGRFPLWASSPTGGTSLFASTQPGVLYPLHLLWALMPIGIGTGIIMALKIWLAGLGMWGLLRAMGLHPTACGLGAVGLMFSASLINWLPWQHSGVYLMLPWLAWAAYAWCIQGSRIALAALAALVACAIFGGHPETLFIIGLVLTLWVFGLLVAGPWRQRSEWLRRGRLVAGLVLAVMLGFGLGAVQLLPFFEGLELSYGNAQRGVPELWAYGRLQNEQVWNWVLPRTYGYFAGGVLAPGRSFTEENAYFGLAPLLGIALVPLAALRRRLRYSLALPWVGILLFALIICLDDTLGYLIRLQPGFNKSVNVRWITIVSFAGLVVAAFGWDWLARRKLPAAFEARRDWWPRGWLGGAGCVLLVQGAILMGLHMTNLLPQPVLERNGPWQVPNESYRLYWIVWAVAVAAATLGAVALWCADWRGRRFTPLLLGAVLLVDLGVQTQPLNHTSVIERYYPQTSILSQVRAQVPATERLVTQSGVFPSNTSLVYNIRDWRAQDPMTTARAHEAATFLDPTMAANGWKDYNMFLDDIQLQVAPLLGIRYYLIPAPLDPNTSTVTDTTKPQFTRLANTEGLGLWRAEGVPGFAYLSDNVQAVEGEKEAAQWMRSATWERTRAFPALVEAPASQVESVQRDPAGQSPGSVNVTHYTPGKIRLDVKSARPSLLVVGESWYPGWRARLDGGGVGILRANYLSQGVVVPAGDHVVELEYNPGSFRYGALLSLLSALGVAILMVWARQPKLKRFTQLFRRRSAPGPV